MAACILDSRLDPSLTAVMIDPNYFRCLREAWPSFDEGFRLLFCYSFARTLVHEVAHTIAALHPRVRGHHGVGHFFQQREAYFDRADLEDQALPELGYALDQYLFGGTTFDCFHEPSHQKLAIQRWGLQHIPRCLLHDPKYEIMGGPSDTGYAIQTGPLWSLFSKAAWAKHPDIPLTLSLSACQARSPYKPGSPWYDERYQELIDIYGAPC